MNICRKTCVLMFSKFLIYINCYYGRQICKTGLSSKPLLGEAFPRKLLFGKAL